MSSSVPPIPCPVGAELVAPSTVWGQGQDQAQQLLGTELNLLDKLFASVRSRFAQLWEEG